MRPFPENSWKKDLQELNNKVDEKRVNELIAAAKLEESTSAQTDSKITSNKVKEVIQNQVKEQNLEAKEREKNSTMWSSSTLLNQHPS